MATLAQETPQDVLRGLPILKDLIANHAVGVVPHGAVQYIRDSYDVDLADLQASAVSEARDETRLIEVAALAKAAYAMGKRDGARIIANRRGLSSEMSIEDFREVVTASGRVPSVALGYKTVMEAYVRGMRAAAAILYVRRTNPLERRRQIAEARAVRAGRDPVQAEDLVETSKAELQAAASVDLNSYATSLSAYAMAAETADAVAVDVLAEQVTDLARAMPHRSTTELLQRARLVNRAAAASDLQQKSYRRIAWLPVSMLSIEEAAAQGRAMGPELVAEKPAARSRAR